MRIRGRRVIWLLASALPLLAEDKLSVAETTTIGDPVVDDSNTSVGEVEPSKPQHILGNDNVIDEDENDGNTDNNYAASKAIHNDDEFRLPPLPKSEYPPIETIQPSDSQDETKDDGDVVQLAELTEELDPESGEVDTGDSGQIENAENVPGDDTRSEDDDPIDGSEKLKDAELDSVKISVETEKKVDNSGEGTHVQASEDKQVEEEDEDVPRPDGIDGDHDPVLDDSQVDKDPLAEQNDTTPEDASISKPSEADEDEDEEDSLSRVSVDYASKSAGALIIEKSSGFKGTSNLLNGDKDKYAIAPCEEKKFVVVGLSEDILVKQIKLANYERFSSSVKDFQVMGSQTLGKWFDLGTYSAKAGNGEQTFDLQEPAWVRYLKFKFLSHHGVEYYCTYSQIKVHGSTMVQGFHEQWEESAADQDEDVLEEQPEADDSTDAKILVEAVVADPATPAKADDGGNASAIDDVKKKDDIPATNEQTRSSPEQAESSKSAECVLQVERCPLKQSSVLDDMLHGTFSDEELFSSLYDLIPSTLSALSNASRNSPGRQTTGGELRTLHQIGSLAIQSIYSTSKNVADAAKALISDSTHKIATPAMTDEIGDSLGEYIITELEQLTKKWNIPVLDAPELKVAEGTVQVTVNQTNQTASNASAQAGANDTSALQNTTDSGVVEEKKVTEIEAVQHETSSMPKRTVDEEGEPQVLPAVADPETSMDQALAKMLENLPSADCLSKLDYAQFKAKMMASKKAHGGPGAASTSGASSMEPIFKKLTDEIKALQSSLSIHDQFTKASTLCYQRVLLDLIAETDRLRTDQEQRLLRLENEFRESQSSLLWKIPRLMFGAFRVFSRWIYVALVYIYSWAIVGFAALVKTSLHFFTWLFRSALLQWPAVKNALLSNKDGANDVGKYLRQLTDQMDQLVLQMEVRDSKLTADEQEEMWKFPVVPIVLLILLGRFVMCFAPSAQIVSPGLRRELIVWSYKGLSPVKKEKSPSKRSSKDVPESKKRVEKSIKSSEPNDDTPPLVVDQSSADQNGPSGDQLSGELPEAQIQAGARPRLNDASSQAVTP